ncbi:MAG: response regulator [Candidatus Bathyarchaeia archaeon]|nr:response regulator [Candidatus Bathyarchaeia archaeon]
MAYARADSAETGRQALRKAEKKFYNLALIDIKLPDIEGVELLTKIKETKPKMRKNIITGYPTLKNAVEALNRGADAYIMKPLDRDKVLATVEEQLEKRKKNRKTTRPIHQNQSKTNRTKPQKSRKMQKG